jgi:hypothetical protein
MLKRSSRYISRKANGKLVVIFLGLQLFFSLWVFPFFTRQFGPGEGQPMLDLMFGFSPEQANTIFSAYGEAGRSGTILTTAFADSLYPFVYAGLLALAISWFQKDIPLKNPKWKYLNLLPFTALIFDFVENASIITLLTSYPQQLSGIARIASAAGMLKWTMVLISVVTLITIILWSWVAPFFKKS